MNATDMTQAVESAVDLVNTHSGLACVHLRFADDLDEIDFVANSASFQNGQFQFQAGFDTYGGSVTELSDIRTELIAR